MGEMRLKLPKESKWQERTNQPDSVDLPQIVSLEMTVSKMPLLQSILVLWNK
jgi:hypothetical protein